MKDILDAIDAALARKKLSAAAASRLAVGNPSLIKNLQNRRARERDHPVENLQKLAEVLDLEFYFGPPRALTVTDQPAGPAEDSAFVPVPVHLAELAAGAGAENGMEGIDDYIAFRADWLNRLGLSASNAALVRARGDSMVPTIECGDLLLLDTARTTPPAHRRAAHDRRRPPIFALRDGTGARVKRLDRVEAGRLLLISDNPATPPEIASDADIVILGRVRWWGRVAPG
ncbi:S24 family peptidase [Rhodovulum sp. P5]|uniref:S24 family peptidase n=1 Tax=Rhodovulum sp. P5 TaxID=1564506 RepID=UPI0012EC8A54|nr:S24 family peptidase [Rhodovulum sp. P5]